MAKKQEYKKIDAIRHEAEKRKNIPTAEYQSMLNASDSKPKEIRYPRNTDLDPQLMWRGKDEQDWSDLIVQAPTIYIQEKVHPKALIDDLVNQSKISEPSPSEIQIDLFSDFNGISKEADKTEFYKHEQNWSNRMILGDSLQVMASLAEREGLQGMVQCIYIDPPYGIKFNSNFQWSTTSRDVKDGKSDHITREPEQVKAFRDTWKDGIHSYLTYLRDRLTVARDLLTESGSIFIQIGDENVNKIRSLMDEVYGEKNFCNQIAFSGTSGFSSTLLSRTLDYILWYCKDISKIKYRPLFSEKTLGGEGATLYKKVQINGKADIPLGKWMKDNSLQFPIDLKLYKDVRFFGAGDLTSQGKASENQEYIYNGKSYTPGINNHWKANFPTGLDRLKRAERIYATKKTINYIRYLDDFEFMDRSNIWLDTSGQGQYGDTGKIYVVQTANSVIERCILMASDPGDLILDPTCGSGTSAYIAEQWGRRWITIDTSRVAIALARARIMGAKFPYYFLADSREGQIKEAEVTKTVASSRPVYNNVRQGFVYDRVPHITLKSIANNTEIDVIWDKYQKILEPIREKLNAGLKENWQEWEIPRETENNWAENIKKHHNSWCENITARQKEIERSIAAKVEFEYLYDRPFEDKKVVRVAGPFTVESLSPHRMLGIDENDDLIDDLTEKKTGYGHKNDFTKIILDNLKISGVQQANKEDKIMFTELIPWPGDMVCAEGKFKEGNIEKRAAVFIGPEFGTVQRSDLVAAAREAADAAFDVLITCAFNYEAHATEFSKLGHIPVLKARMNADLHMAEDLKNTGKGNLFIIFGEPDIRILEQEDGRICVKVFGVDIFKPQTGEILSNGTDGIACWFIDTDYNEESFFVRHAYFLGANDPYKSLKTTLRAEINQEAWETLLSDTSRPFDKPKSGRIAVKVINHLGDEVMKIFKV